MKPFEREGWKDPRGLWASAFAQMPGLCRDLQAPPEADSCRRGGVSISTLNPAPPLLSAPMPLPSISFRVPVPGVDLRGEWATVPRRPSGNGSVVMGCISSALPLWSYTGTVCQTSQLMPPGSLCIHSFTQHGLWARLCSGH